ncbi:hypothetical protein [Amycolatopsis sp.]|uniref:hypothetical protein n=1 Tax=Amycolatopsis sp. TaxID=37632 RepID=UPI002DF7A96D|nr:hypothetical protein [Amycolatopsis sp.]
MGKLIGGVAAVLVGLALAAGGSLTLVNVSDPDASPELKSKIEAQVNPQSNPNTVYGNR